VGSAFALRASADTSIPTLGTIKINDLAQFLSSISKAKKRETYRELTVFSGKSASKMPTPMPIRQESIHMKLLLFQ
jgi:hypothetical protein